MASFCYRIRSTQKNKLVKIQILFTVGRGNQFYVDSQYMVLTDAWDNKRQTVKSRFTFTDDFTEQQGRGAWLRQVGRCIPDCKEIPG